MTLGQFGPPVTASRTLAKTSAGPRCGSRFSSFALERAGIAHNNGTSAVLLDIRQSQLADMRSRPSQEGQSVSLNPGDHGQAKFVLLVRPMSFYWEPFQRLSLRQETVGASKVAMLEAQPLVARARRSAMQSRMMAASSRLSVPVAHRCIARRSTVMPVSAARFACCSLTPLSRRAVVMAAA